MKLPCLFLCGFAYIDWTELDWRNRSELPKKKLDEYTRYLRDGIVPASYNNNNKSNISNHTTTTTTSTGSGSKKLATFEVEEEETTVKLEEME